MVRAAVNIPFVGTMLDSDKITATDTMATAATVMLDELAKVATALEPLHHLAVTNTGRAPLGGADVVARAAGHAERSESTP